jgi:hypothetical protein
MAVVSFYVLTERIRLEKFPRASTEWCHGADAERDTRAGKSETPRIRNPEQPVDAQ